jgi:DNA polymerase-3 subunit epsilon
MKKVTFYDTETTGLPSWKEPSGGENQPHLVQLSAIQCDFDSREILQRLDLIIKPNGWTIPEEVTEIHGITTEKAMDCGVDEYSVLRLMLEICRGSERCAHNRTFDQRIIRIGLKRYGFADEDIDRWAEKEDHHCTMLKAKPIMELPPRGKWGWKNPKLEEAYKFFCGRELGDKAHSSIFDTEACMDVYWAMLDYKKTPRPAEPVKNPCPECKKEWDHNKDEKCPHCGETIPF